MSGSRRYEYIDQTSKSNLLKIHNCVLIINQKLCQDIDWWKLYTMLFHQSNARSTRSALCCLLHLCCCGWSHMDPLKAHPYTLLFDLNLKWIHLNWTEFTEVNQTGTYCGLLVRNIRFTPPGLGDWFTSLLHVCGVCMFSLPFRVSSWCNGILLQSKDMSCRLNGISNVCEVVMCECKGDCALQGISVRVG